MPTRSGNTRWVVRTEDGDTFSTFRPEVGREAERRRGHQVRVTYHESQADGFHNVYLDAIQPAPERPDGPVEPADQGHPEPEGGPADPEAVAWNTAIEAAPGWQGRPGPRSGRTPGSSTSGSAPSRSWWTGTSAGANRSTSARTDARARPPGRPGQVEGRPAAPARSGGRAGLGPPTACRK